MTIKKYSAEYEPHNTWTFCNTLKILSTNMSKAMRSRKHYSAQTKQVLGIGVVVFVFSCKVFLMFSCSEEDETAKFWRSKHSWGRLWLPSSELSGKAKFSPCKWTHFQGTTEIRAAVYGINEHLMTSKSSLAYGK